MSGLAAAGALAAAVLLSVNGAPDPSAPEGVPIAPVAKGPEAMDYLIQDVCVNAAGAAIAGDPATCRLKRNLRVGERLPYLVTDIDRSGKTARSAFSSIPVRGTDGSTKVLVVKTLGRDFVPGYRFSFSGKYDAFDLIDTSNSRFASVVRTFDGGCFDQIFSRNGRSRSLKDRAGGWVLFPLDTPPSQWPQTSSLELATYRSQISPGKKGCGNNHALGITFWTRPATYQFETGKRLLAIRSEHFAAADLQTKINSFERFFFTREYGMTRWEAWQTVSACRASFGAASPRCSAATGDVALRSRCALGIAGQMRPGVERHGGQDWVRLDCRDFTNHAPLRQPQLPLAPEIARGGGLVDIDYARSVGG